jgi:hypothetical protein
MGRTKTRHREWRRQVRKHGQKSIRRTYNSYTWDYMSPGRLVAWAEWEEGGETDAKENACPCEGQATS